MEELNKNQIFTDMHELLKKHYGANLFECFNENAHSKFLVYLFKKYPKLLKNFLKLIPQKTEELGIEGPTIKNQYENIDIFIELNDLVLVIEVKLDAKFSTNNDKCQLKTYYDKITEDYPNKKKSFILLCISDRLTTAQNEMIENLKKNKKEYSILDWSDVILLLKEYSCSHADTIDDFDTMLIKKYILFWEFYSKNNGYSKIIKIGDEYKNLWQIWDEPYFKPKKKKIEELYDKAINEKDKKKKKDIIKALNEYLDSLSV